MALITEPFRPLKHPRPQVKELVTTGFFGRRDGYQVPLALRENSLLDTHIGDWRPISKRKVPTSWFGATLLLASRREALRRTGWLDPYRGADAMLGMMIARRSRRRGTRALVYSYHWPGYLAGGGHPERATLFMVHPPPGLIRSVLKAARSDDSEYGHLSPEPEEQWSADEADAVDEALGSASHVFCTSQFVADGLRVLGSRCTRPAVVPYGIHPCENRSESLPGRLTLLWIGQPTYRKGFFHLLRALRPFGSKVELRCLIRGQMVTDGVTLPDNVDIRCDVQDAELATHFAAADMFVMPSLAEGFGLVLLEAMAHGVPVLTTQSTGVAGLIQSGGGGVLVEAGNVSHLTRSIEGLVDNPRELRIMGEAAWSSSLTFTWGRFREEVRQQT